MDARIGLAADAPEIRVMDGDGLVDVVRSAGSSYEVWFALGRYEGGDGLFGTVDWSSGAPVLSMAPVMTCVPWSGQPIRLSDSDIAVADMNGDGQPDLVRVRENDIKYWPGRGDGTYGTGVPVHRPFPTQARHSTARTSTRSSTATTELPPPSRAEARK